jgi:NitT/TauT family transport system permease protein
MMRRSRILGVISRLFVGFLNLGSKSRKPLVIRPRVGGERGGRLGDFIWYAAIALVGVIALLKAVQFVFAEITLTEVRHVVLLGFLTFLRVGVLIAIASLIWVPIGVYVGMRPRVASVVQPVAQFLAAFPVNLIYPIVVSGIVLWKLNPDIWLSPLMILGTQWYILFNVIVGASAIPGDMRYAGQNFHVRGWLWWKRIALPAVFPFYVTGAITASGGSWNASVVSEVAEWGQEHLHAAGLGSYISHATGTGDFRRTVVGIVVMALFVVVINRVFWKPLFARAERKFRMT